MIKKYSDNRTKRHRRIRGIVSGDGKRPRLAVFRSSEHIYAQLIDDIKGQTLAQANDTQIEKKMTKTERAQEVGTAIAAAAKKEKVTTVTFDRGGFAYHGRVKALAEAARAGGLKF